MKSVLLLVALLSAGCGVAAPDAGHEIVLIKKPILFGGGGIVSDSVHTSTYVAWTTQEIDVNMQPQQVALEFDDLMTKDGVPLDFHAAIQFRITDSVRLVREFGGDTLAYDNKATVPGFFYRTLEQSFRAQVRDSVKRHGLNEMAIDTSAADEVDRDVTAKFTTLIAQTKVPIVLMGVTLGRANPPDAIKHQRVATAEQEQRIKTEQQRKLAEDERKSAEESRAAADRAYNVKMELTGDQYLRLEAIKMQRDVCAGGKCTFLLGGGAVPTIDVR